MADTPLIVRTVEDLRAAVAAWRADGRRVGFAPTMGALHDGHLSLVRLAGARADKVAASVFVNPAQFAQGEDFDTYPRREAEDAALLAEAGCELVFAPSAEIMYPAGFSTSVTVSGVTEGLESAMRPHFFGGVATVVTKLLNQARPDVAVFGEKDYQQLLVIKRLAADLDFGIEIVGGPTVREADGLAMSSRNAYLSEPERKTAAALNRVMFDTAGAVAAGGEPVHAERQAEAALLTAGFDAVDYVAVRDAETLGPPQEGRAMRVLIAARLGSVRLIDNAPVA